jgi:oxygen-independent coproporphyrinogen-3 oxidase
MYMLEIYPNAPLRDAMARGRWSVAPDDDVAEMYMSGLDRMDNAGYVQYEISNAARPGRESRHNLKYWTDGEWLGFGCGAHSTRDGVRWKNLSSTEEYIAAVEGDRPVATERRVLAAADRLEEALFTGLRLNAGLDLPAVKDRYAIDVWARFGGELQPFVEQGVLLYDGRSLKLTRAGMLLAHEIMAVFIR